MNHSGEIILIRQNITCTERGVSSFRMRQLLQLKKNRFPIDHGSLAAEINIKIKSPLRCIFFGCVWQSQWYRTKNNPSNMERLVPMSHLKNDDEMFLAFKQMQTFFAYYRNHVDILLHHFTNYFSSNRICFITTVHFFQLNMTHHISWSLLMGIFSPLYIIPSM